MDTFMCLPRWAFFCSSDQEMPAAVDAITAALHAPRHPPPPGAATAPGTARRTGAAAMMMMMTVMVSGGALLDR